MFKTLSNLTKAVVGVTVRTPISVVADVITLGGVLTERKRTYTSESLGNVMDNLKEATKADKD